jgi:GNAT superfamily N-acetyltransferase
VVGSYVLVPQDWGYLRSLLAVEPAYRGLGLGRRLVEAAKDLLGPATSAGTIESCNRNSLELSASMGFEVVAEFASYTFTRQRPSLKAGVRTAEPLEFSHICDALRMQHHEWFDPTHLRTSEFWVSEDLSSGLQLCGAKWRLLDLGLPRLLDRSVRRVLPWLGISDDPHIFAFAHYWFGNPEHWETILEHAMAQLHLQSIVLVGDVQSPLWASLRRHVSCGATGTLLGTNSLKVTSNRPQWRPIHFTPINAV